MKTIDYNDFSITIGQKDFENWLIIDKAKETTKNQTNISNWWFHLDGFPSSHVILTFSGLMPTTEMIDIAAAACKANSKQKNGLNVRVVYGPIEGVTKDVKGRVGSVFTNEKMMKRMKI